MTDKARTWLLTAAGACLGFALVEAGYPATTWQFWAVTGAWVVAVAGWL